MNSIFPTRTFRNITKVYRTQGEQPLYTHTLQPTCHVHTRRCRYLSRGYAERLQHEITGDFTFQHCFGCLQWAKCTTTKQTKSKAKQANSSLKKCCVVTEPLPRAWRNWLHETRSPGISRTLCLVGTASFPQMTPSYEISSAVPASPS